MTMDNTSQGLSGSDIRGGILQADDVVKGVQGDIRSLARDTRWQGLSGADRDEFFKGMTQDEWDMLQNIGYQMGPKGVNKLQSVLQEMVDLKKTGDN